nr:PREDICTED: uncharacterized protein LOC108216991 [Daucus carota subsp. sativus]
MTRSKTASEGVRVEEPDHADTLSSPAPPIEKWSKVANGELVPPPPPLPTNLQHLKHIKKMNVNEGVGCMAAYTKLQESIKRREEEEKEREIELMNNAKAGENQEGTNVVQEDEPKIKRRRGPTKMSSVFTRRLDERPELYLNHELQPVSDDSKIRAEFSSFLGKLSRECVPLDYVNWKQIPAEEKNSWWEFIKQKYIIPEEGKDWIMKTIDESWRVYKSRFKAHYYTKYDTDEDRLKNRPQHISLEQFKSLIAYWGDEFVKEKARKNVVNRQKVKDKHKAGRKSFAQIGNEIKKKKNLPKSPSKGKIYPKTRKFPKKKAGDNLEEEVSDHDSVELDFDNHAPNWLLGRSGRTRKTMLDKMQKREKNRSEELIKLREELSLENLP